MRPAALAREYGRYAFCRNARQFLKMAEYDSIFKKITGELFDMKSAAQKDLFQIERSDIHSDWFASYLEKLHTNDEVAGWPDKFGSELKKWMEKNRKRFNI